MAAMAPGRHANGEQVAMAEQVAARACRRLRLGGWRGDIMFGCGPTTWHVEAPAADEPAVLAALFGVEAGNFAAALAYVGDPDSAGPPVARDLLASGLCSPACLLALADDGSCDCRCRGKYHGVLADTGIDEPETATARPPAPRPGDRHGRRQLDDDLIMVERLPREHGSFDRIVRHGYVVTCKGHSGTVNAFFDALEPALVFGRAARMSHEFLSYNVHRGAWEQREFPDHRAPVDVLYVVGNGLDRADDERKHLRRWVDGVDPTSSHWPPTTAFGGGLHR